MSLFLKDILKKVKVKLPTYLLVVVCLLTLFSFYLMIRYAKVDTTLVVLTAIFFSLGVLYIGWFIFYSRFKKNKQEENKKEEEKKQ